MLDKFREKRLVKDKYAESQSPEDLDEPISVHNLALLWIKKVNWNGEIMCQKKAVM